MPRVSRTFSACSLTSGSIRAYKLAVLFMPLNIHFCTHKSNTFLTKLKLKNVINERRIPFEVREPAARYNASDIEALMKGIEQLDAGKELVKTMEELEAMENG